MVSKYQEGGVSQPDPRKPIDWARYRDPNFFQNPALYSIPPQDLVNIVRTNDSLRVDQDYFIQNYNRYKDQYNKQNPTLFRTNSMSRDKQSYLTGYTGMDFTKLATDNVVTRENGGRIFQMGGTSNGTGQTTSEKKQGYTPTIPEVVSGAFLTGVDPKQGMEPNAELEHGEQVRFPDGSIAKVLGESHKNGGVNLILPDMTEVLSNTKDLTLTRADIKMLEKEYGLKNLTTKDTYSKAVDKYARKTGYNKNLQEELDILEKIADVTKKSMSEGSSQVNNAYMAEKYRKNQEARKPLQDMLSNFYTKVFDRQQAQKQSNGMETEEQLAQQGEAPYNADIASDLTQEEVFELGGTYGFVKGQASKYGKTEREVYNFLKDGGHIKKRVYETGGPTGGIYTISKNKNVNSERDRPKLQPEVAQGYGSVSSAEDALTELYKNFPLIFNKEEYKKYFTIEDGAVKLKPNVNPKEKTLYSQLQKDMDGQMRSTAQYIIDDKTNRFGEEDKKTAQQYLENETFATGKDAREFDSKLGNFTSGRFSLRTNLVTPKEQELLNDQGIFTYKQLQNSDVELSEATKERIKNFSEGIPNNADFGIDTYTPVGTPASEQKAAEEAQGTPVNENGLTPTDPRTRGNRMFQMPDQRYLPPLALQAESLYTSELGRIDPIKIGIEDTLKQNSDNLQFIAGQVQNLPPSQAASVMAAAIAQNQKSEGQAITAANTYNAQAEAQAEMFNIGQSDRETTGNQAARLNYEQRALLGLSKTDQDIRNWYNANREVLINNFQEQQYMNTMNNLFPKFAIDPTATGTYFDPLTNTYVYRSNSEYQSAVSLTNQPKTATKATT